MCFFYFIAMKKIAATTLYMVCTRVYFWLPVVDSSEQVSANMWCLCRSAGDHTAPSSREGWRQPSLALLHNHQNHWAETEPDDDLSGCPSVTHLSSVYLFHIANVKIKKPRRSEETSQPEDLYQNLRRDAYRSEHDHYYSEEPRLSLSAGEPRLTPQ